MILPIERTDSAVESLRLVQLLGAIEDVIFVAMTLFQESFDILSVVADHCLESTLTRKTHND